MIKNIKVLFFIIMILLTTLGCVEKPTLNIVFIGDSITEGYGLIDLQHNAPPIKTVEYLQNKYNVNYQSVAVSGAWAMHFVPEKGIIFPDVIKTADKLYEQHDGLFVFSICLGTNDSAGNLYESLPIVYEENMKKIVDTLLNRYDKSIVILHHPIYFRPESEEGTFNGDALKRLNLYSTKLDQMVASNPTRILQGDRDAYTFFEKNYANNMIQEGSQSSSLYLHPNNKGADRLGRFWARGIEDALANR